MPKNGLKLIFLPIILTTATAYAIFLSTPLGQMPGGAYTHVSRTFAQLPLWAGSVGK